MGWNESQGTIRITDDTDRLLSINHSPSLPPYVAVTPSDSKSFLTYCMERGWWMYAWLPGSPCHSPVQPSWFSYLQGSPMNGFLSSRWTFKTMFAYTIIVKGLIFQDTITCWHSIASRSTSTRHQTNECDDDAAMPLPWLKEGWSKSADSSYLGKRCETDLRGSWLDTEKEKEELSSVTNWRRKNGWTIPRDLIRIFGVISAEKKKKLLWVFCEGIKGFVVNLSSNPPVVNLSTTKDYDKFPMWDQNESVCLFDHERYRCYRDSLKTSEITIDQQEQQGLVNTLFMHEDHWLDM